jgi:hypothetical protein
MAIVLARRVRLDTPPRVLSPAYPTVLAVAPRGGDPARRHPRLRSTVFDKPPRVLSPAYPTVLAVAPRGGTPPGATRG